MRAQYEAHIAAVLKLAGVSDPQARAARVLALEVRIAQAHAPDSEGAVRQQADNPWKRADFIRKALAWTGGLFRSGRPFPGQSGLSWSGNRRRWTEPRA